MPKTGVMAVAPNAMVPAINSVSCFKTHVGQPCGNVADATGTWLCKLVWHMQRETVNSICHVCRDSCATSSTQSAQGKAHLLGAQTAFKREGGCNNANCENAQCTGSCSYHRSCSTASPSTHTCLQVTCLWVQYITICIMVSNV